MPTKYFYLRSFDHEVTISSEPSPSGVWYAVWSQNGTPTWTSSNEPRPTLKSGEVGACVVAYGEPLLDQTPLGGGSKEIPPPPWLQGEHFTDFASFQTTVEVHAPRLFDLYRHEQSARTAAHPR
jgi:hypothetical protein